MDSMHFEYAIHSDFLIHWTGKDIDNLYDQHWYDSHKSETSKSCDDCYLKRLYDILQYGLWMTSENEDSLCLDGKAIEIPATPKTSFTELKLSESRKHARRYGRLGIGVKRTFVFDRCGRPLVYYGLHKNKILNDLFLQKCSTDLSDKKLLNFFKPMNSSSTLLNYDLYAESEWRILYLDKLLSEKLIIDPRKSENAKEHRYFNALTPERQAKLEFLIPLDGWFAMIIYPSLGVKNKAQQEAGIRKQIERIKKLPDNANNVEGCNRPIELDLDACKNF